MPEGAEVDIVLFESIVLIEVSLSEDEDIVLKALLQLEVYVQIIHSRLNQVVYLTLLRLFRLQILSAFILTLLAEEMCCLR